MVSGRAVRLRRLLQGHGLGDRARNPQRGTSDFLQAELLEWVSVNWKKTFFVGTLKAVSGGPGVRASAFPPEQNELVAWPLADAGSEAAMKLLGYSVRSFINALLSCSSYRAYQKQEAGRQRRRSLSVVRDEAAERELDAWIEENLAES